MDPSQKLEIDPEELLMNVKKGGIWLNFEALWNVIKIIFIGVLL